jgi:exodeoxyribonuclease-3
VAPSRPMKIASWNINSVRARTERFIDYLNKSKPDVLCVQELKCQDHEFPTGEVNAAGYDAITFGQKTYNGVAILTKKDAALTPTDVVKGLDDGEDEGGSRVIAATIKGVRIVNVYATNGGASDEAYEFKLKWFHRLRGYLDERHSKESSLVLTGDFNVAPEPIDVHDPKAWEGHVLFSKPEREALAEVIAFGLHDSFREKNPGVQAFSWWDYRQLAFPKAHGLRIDHVLLTPSLMKRCTASAIEREFRKGKQPSDHAPIHVELDV